MYVRQANETKEGIPKDKKSYSEGIPHYFIKMGRESGNSRDQRQVRQLNYYIHVTNPRKARHFSAKFEIRVKPNT